MHANLIRRNQMTIIEHPETGANIIAEQPMPAVMIYDDSTDTWTLHQFESNDDALMFWRITHIFMCDAETKSYGNSHKHRMIQEHFEHSRRERAALEESDIHAVIGA